MRTRIMNEAGGGTPWFEYYQVGGSRPVKQEVKKLPYVVGRDEAADFCVDSSRVSRKHVAIEFRDDSYVLRDLESTNGSYVNGKRVTEVALADGDVVVIADFEFTFFSGQPQGRANVTQVMTQPVGDRPTDAVDMIIQVRRLQERLTHRSVDNRFRAIMDLESESVFGYEACRELSDLPGESRQAESLIDNTECRLTERVNQQHRLCAVEQAALLPEGQRLFFGLKASEINADSLLESLDRLGTAVTGRHQLVAEIPESAVCDIPYFRQFVADLRERRFEVAFGGFCMGPSQIAEWHAMAPDYLKLAPAVVRGIRRASGGYRMVQSLLNAARDLGCDVIATGVDSETDAQCLRDVGCPFAQGDFFGRPETVATLMQAVNSAPVPQRR
jgi:EAL domain-containing protein (putative c-di-GMP-specific phosphodiesterase class I)